MGSIFITLQKYNFAFNTYTIWIFLNHYNNPNRKIVVINFDYRIHNFKYIKKLVQF